MSTTALQPTNQPTSNVFREDDTRQHIEDTDLVNAIRNGRLVQVTWNQLTPDEQRAAFRNMFLEAGFGLY